MTDPDARAFLHYEHPASRGPAPGDPSRRPERALTRHVPVRFRAETIESRIGARESARGRTTPRDTIKLEDVLEAEREVAGSTPPDNIEKLRREIARKRYGRGRR